MGKIQIIFGTVHGQSEKIANAMADALRAKGRTVDVARASHDLVLNWPEVEMVIIGGGVQAGGYPKPLVAWVKANATKLKQIKTAFFSVCMGVLQKENEEVQAEERRIVEEFFRKTGWKTSSVGILAGALPFTKYGFFIKWVMKNISKKAGGPTDTSRDYEFTDWNEVRDFACRQLES